MQAYLEEVISDLTQTEQLLVEYRYLSCMTWEDIAEGIRYSERQVHRLHGRILQKLAKIA